MTKKHSSLYPPPSIKVTELQEFTPGRMVTSPGSRIYVNFNGRDVTRIVTEANAAAGWVRLVVTDGSGNALLDGENEVCTVELYGDVQIILEERVKRVSL